MDVEGIEAFAAELGDWIVSWPARPFDGNTEFDLWCPKHEDPETSNKPSCTWQPLAKNGALSLGVFCCHTPGCDLPSDGRRVQLLWRKRQGTAPIIDMSKWRTEGEEGDPSKPPKKARAKSSATLSAPIDDETWDVYREFLYDEPERIDWFADDKGITEETLRKFDWAWIQRKECYIYPVYRIDGELEGWRLYDPFHLKAKPPRDKKRWFRTREHHTNQLYGVSQFEGTSSVILPEGETDLMMLHQDGYVNSITQTGGAGTWKPEWSEWFRDKVVYTCYDPDKAGLAGRQSVSKALKNIAQAVYHIEMPDGMDYCEWRKAGHVSAEFAELISSAKEDWRRASDGLPTDGVPLDSVSRVKDATPDRILTLRAYVAGKVETPWSLPKRIELTCGVNQGKKCEHCPRGHMEPGQTSPVEFRPDEDDCLVEMMGENNANLNRIIADACDLRCQVIEYTTDESWLVEQVSIQDPVDAGRGILSDTRYSAFHFYDGETTKVEPSHDYRIVGRRLADPRDQRLVLTAWNAERTTSDLDSFVLTPATRAQLQKFRPTRKGLIGLKIHLNKKYKDLAANVTKIASRQDLHLMYDLVAHSVPAFTFHRKTTNKGMLDCIVIGDTRTGKTELVDLLNAHYGVGYLVSGENSSYAGLVGGSAEVSGSRARMPEWGVLPRHHRRFVTIDESSGMANLISQMSGVRTSGRAQIHKQGGGEVPALVRLLWLSNPVSHNQSGKTRPINEYHGGAVDAIIDLVKATEDVARFDLAMVVASDEVPEDAIQELRNTEYPRTYRSEDCHEMIMFAWTRRTDQIVFAPGVTEDLYESSRRLAARYIEQPPLVQAANMVEKLARLTIALATMVYSTAEDGETVVVLPEHVQYIEEYVRRCYDNPLFGYGKQSDAKHHFIRLGQDSTDEVRDWLAGAKLKDAESQGLPNGQDVASTLIMFDSLFQNREFTDSMQDMGANNALRWLSERGMLERTGTRLKITRVLRSILEEVTEKGRDNGKG